MGRARATAGLAVALVAAAGAGTPVSGQASPGPVDQAASAAAEVLSAAPAVPAAPALPALPAVPSVPRVEIPQPPRVSPVTGPAPPSPSAAPTRGGATSTPSSAASGPAAPRRSTSTAAGQTGGGAGAGRGVRSPGTSATARSGASPRRGPRGSRAAAGAIPTPQLATSPGLAASVRSPADALRAVGESLPLPLPVPDWSKPIILLLALLALGFAVRARFARRRTTQLEAQRAELLEDLDVMQAALVPEVPESLRELGVSAAYRPAEGPAAGGDFYDVFALGGGRTAIIVGDVCGHGREALGRAAFMHYTLRAYMEAGLDPRMTVKLAGRVLGRDSGTDDGSFTTVAVAVYDAARGTLTHVTAGHPPPILIGPAAHEPVTAGSSPPLGWPVPTGRRQTTVSLSAGSVACFYTDGLIEARVDGALLGEERLVETLGELGPSATAEALLERVREVADETRDDTAACIVSATGPAHVRDFRVEELELDLEKLDDPVGEHFLAACAVPREEAAGALARARPIAREFGSALLRVEITGDGSMVTVAAPVSIGGGPQAGDALALESLTV